MQLAVPVNCITTSPHVKVRMVRVRLYRVVRHTRSLFECTYSITRVCAAPSAPIFVFPIGTGTISQWAQQSIAQITQLPGL
jgi:hypothetical protein